MPISIPNAFVPGTTILSADVNENFDALGAAALNRGGDTLTGNIAADAGVTVDGVDLSERVLDGVWQSIAFNAADFTAESGNWTVDSGDVAVAKYMVIGDTMWVSLFVQTSDVSATPAYLAFAVPGGYSAANYDNALGVGYNAGAVDAAVRVYVEGFAGTIIKIARLGGSAWSTTSSDNTGVQFTIAFQVV